MQETNLENNLKSSNERSEEEEIPLNGQEVLTNDFDIVNDSEYFKKLVLKTESVPLGGLTDDVDKSVEEFINLSFKYLDEHAPKSRMGLLALNEEESNRLMDIQNRAKKLEQDLNVLRAQKERKKLFDQGELMEKEIKMTTTEKRKQIFAGLLELGEASIGTPLALFTILGNGGGALEDFKNEFKMAVKKIQDAQAGKKYNEYDYKENFVNNI